MTNGTRRSLRCPQCGKVIEERGPHFPFCSERCRLVDLSRWLDGEYRISRPLRADDDTGTLPHESPDDDAAPAP